MKAILVKDQAAGTAGMKLFERPEPQPLIAIDFVVESDRAQLSEIVERVRDGRLRTNIGNVSALDEAVVRRRCGRAISAPADWKIGNPEMACRRRLRRIS
jgi:hypothetical protein